MNYGEEKFLKEKHEYFTVRDLSKLIGLDCSTIRKDIKKKRLIAKKVLRCYVIDYLDAISYLKRFD